MNTKFFITLIFSFLSLNIYAQTPTWINSIGSSQNDDSYSIDYDAFGNVYVCGWFSGTADFDPSIGVFNMTSPGSTDVFVAKYTPSGQFLWAFKIGQTNRDGAMRIKINNAGEVLVTGYVRGNNIDFDPGVATYLLNAPGLAGTDPGHSGDIFLAKYTSNSQFMWAFIISGQYQSDIGEGLDVDDSDNIYLVGAINATSNTVADADPGVGVFDLAGAGKGHAFVAKYTTNSNFIWAFQLGTWGFNSTVRRIQIIPGDTAFYITGHHISTNADFDPGPGVFPLTSNGGEDIYLGKYSLNGNFIWAFSVGSAIQDVGMELQIDANNDPYISGFFAGLNIDFDPGPSLNTLSSLGASDGYLAKYSKSGTYLWAKSIGSANVDICWGFDIFNNKVISTGEFTNTVDFDPGPAIYNLTSAGGSDIFISQYDTMGNFLCASNIGGNQNERGFSLLTINSDSIILCGSFSTNNLDFDPTLTTLIMPNNGLSDAFVGKYYFSTSIPYTATVIGDTICSGQNPILTLDISPNFLGTFSVTITDGVNTYIVNNVTDNVPFTLNANPNINTIYTILYISNLNPSSCNVGNIPINIPVTVVVYPAPNISAIASPPSVCMGIQTTLSGSGGVSYLWSGGITNGLPFIPIVSSVYTLTGTDANGCNNTATVTVTVNPLPVIIASANPPSVCPGNSTVLTGSGGVTYVWSGGITNGVPFIPLGNSSYTVTGTDANGCTNTSSVTVTLNQNIPITIIPTDPLICIGDSVQLTASGALNYTWANTPGLNTYTGSSVWAYPVLSSTYTVTGTDANGCTGTSSVFISISSGIDVQVTKNKDAECNINIVQLQASGAQNYTWSPANLVNTPTGSLVNATVLQTTTFYVTGNTGSCVDIDSITVYYFNNDETGIIIPNVFSPNNDGLNDCLKVIQNARFTDYYFTIYNRWGEKVFETDDPNACWNGEHKNQPAEMGTYGYFLKAETSCGKIFKKGDITLLR